VRKVPAPGSRCPVSTCRVRKAARSLPTRIESAARSTACAEAGVDITRRARILEQAHDVLVQALATVDKI
jgi:hypothetical protein